MPSRGSPPPSSPRRGRCRRQALAATPGHPTTHTWMRRPAPSCPTRHPSSPVLQPVTWPTGTTGPTSGPGRAAHTPPGLCSTGPPARPRHPPRPAHRPDPAPLLHRPRAGRALRVACKTRRASRCPACAETYRADTYQLVRAGLVGGKGVPSSVSMHPAAFVTLTAPSFGPVHSRRTGKGGGVVACRPGAAAGRARTGGRSPAPSGTRPPTLASGNRSAATASTTPAPCCGTPTPRNCGAGSPWPSAGTSPGRPGYGCPTCGTCSRSPSPRSPNTSGAAWSTSMR